MILSVVEQKLVKEAIQLAEEICGSLDMAGTGFLFTVPVRRVRGFAEEIR